MIILDTNVISEMMRPSPAPEVLRWLHARPLSDLATTSVNVAEIRYGLARLSLGRKRTDLEGKFGGLLVRVFGPRIFAFDRAAAEAYGDLIIALERIGRRLQGFDGLVTAVALAQGFSVATRNARDFTNCGIEVISPWARH